MSDFPSKIILASNSPRRQQLLKEAGINFSISVKDIKEDYPPELSKEEIPLFLARLKAEAFRKEMKEETIITADTVVAINNQILGKPSGEKEAIEMLQLLSGKKHEVITGVCIINSKKELSFIDTTEVYFKKLSDENILYYVKNFKPFDKAGAYGIQEWIGMIGIEKISGSYFNVMGLPVHRVVEELKNFKFCLSPKGECSILN